MEESRNVGVQFTSLLTPERSDGGQVEPVQINQSPTVGNIISGDIGKW